MTLSNKQRVRILQLLTEQGPLGVSAIGEALGIEQSAVSHNLKHLLHCHFVSAKQIGRERIYSINKDTLKPLFKQIERHVQKYCIEGDAHWEARNAPVATNSGVTR